MGVRQIKQGKKEFEVMPIATSAFEAYALDKPELLALIEADTNLRDALSEAALNTPGDGADQHVATDAQAPMSLAVLNSEKTTA